MKSNGFGVLLVFLFACVLISSARKISSPQIHNPKVAEAQKGYHVDGTIGGWGPWFNHNPGDNNGVGVDGRGGGN
ncbi:hypothetical protein Ccrd_015425 [Cynara cardunculus var. scolymus]|uniref:Glycine rich protein n=1 Tax=Cynara cardunculus var. scolymus TaxID=59895 RepID=A0A103YBW2_CYNCS|nr:hypothetical protein Ccrd_015425 [Cynara cardunculus var. scolymus]